MKCSDCKHLFTHSPDYTNPYPEIACMVDWTGLEGLTEGDVKDCKNYEKQI
jgi:hypothetical protein